MRSTVCSRWIGSSCASPFISSSFTVLSDVLYSLSFACSAAQVSVIGHQHSALWPIKP
jgi:hypothetical protein